MNITFWVFDLVSEYQLTCKGAAAAPTKPISTLPTYLHRDQNFRGRDEVLDDIGCRLQESNRVSLRGVGGIGYETLGPDRSVGSS